MKPFTWAFPFVFSALFLWQCDSLERDNPLDPANPSSSRPSVAVAEAFVNTSAAAGTDYNTLALKALDSLKSIFGERLLVIQYHRHTRDFQDSLAVEPLVESRYTAYTIDYNEQRFRRFKGVPDIFVNGPQQHLQGASDTKGVVEGIIPYINAVLGSDSYYTLETDIEAASDGYSGRIRVARLGNRTAENMSLWIVLTTDHGAHGRYSVVRLSSPITVESLAAGDYKSFSFKIAKRNGRGEHLFILLTADATGRIEYALEAGGGK